MSFKNRGCPPPAIPTGRTIPFPPSNETPTSTIQEESSSTTTGSVGPPGGFGERDLETTPTPTLVTQSVSNSTPTAACANPFGEPFYGCFTTESVIGRGDSFLRTPDDCKKLCDENPECKAYSVSAYGTLDDSFGQRVQRLYECAQLNRSAEEAIDARLTSSLPNICLRYPVANKGCSPPPISELDDE